MTLGTNDSNALAFETGGSERARFTTDGNFVIGGTAPQDTTGNILSLIRNQASFTRLEINNSNASGGTNVRYMEGATTVAGTFYENSSDLFWVAGQEDTSGIAFSTGGFIYGDNERMRITPAGNVVIGATAPVDANNVLAVRRDQAGFTRLELNNANASGGTNLRFYEGTSQRASMFYNNSTEEFQIYTEDANSYLTFAVAGTERARFANNGYLGLGTTSTPSRLSLTSGTTAADGISFGSDTNLFRSGADTLRTDDSLSVGGDLTVTGAGTIGTNLTVSAQGDLRLADSDSSNYVALQSPATVGADYTLTLPSAVAGGDDYALVGNASGTLSWLDLSTFGTGDGTVTGTGTQDYLTKWSAGGTGIEDSLIFDNGTNVGIGTDSPSQALEVNGGGLFGVDTDNQIGLNLNSAGSIAEGRISVLSPDTSADLFLNAKGTSGIQLNQDSGSGGVGIYDGSGGRRAYFNSGGSLYLGGSSSPANRLSVNGSASFGAYSGTAAPSNGLIVSGDVGIGTSTVNARLHALSTTEQLRLGYDASNYSSFTISSTGELTIDPTGGLVTVDGTLVPGAGSWTLGTVSNGWTELHVESLIAMNDSFGNLLNIQVSAGNTATFSAADSMRFRTANYSTDDGVFRIQGAAAGGSGYLVTSNPTLNAMNGSDTVRGWFLDLTNANHTGTGNTLIGLDIDGITGDADATETALNVGAGWDYGARIDAADTQTLWLSGNADSTTAAAGIAFGASRDTNLYRSAADTLRTDDSFVVGANLTVNAQGDLRLADADSSNYVAFQSPATVGANYTLTLPAAVAAGDDYALVGNASGIMSWLDLSTFGDGDITAVGSMLSGDAFSNSTADGQWLGLGASAGRIEFTDDTDDAVSIMGGRLGVGTTAPAELVDFRGSGTQLRLSYDDTIYSNFSVDFGGNLNIDTYGGGGVVVNSAASVQGNLGAASLNVTGDTTLGDNAFNNLTVNASIQGANALIFDGATEDTNRTTLAITDPTAARTQTMQDASGTLSLQNGALTQGSVAFVNASGQIDQDNANFFWDDTNNFLGIGVNSGLNANLDIVSTATTGQGMELTMNSITSGTGFNLSSTSNNFTSGVLSNIAWNPSSPTNASGDLFRLSINNNANIGNFINILDNNNSIFSVSETAFTTSLPVNFTAPGDLSLAYDLVFTNQTLGQIVSNGPLSIVAGESFESNNLSLTTFNSGDIILDTASDVITGGAILPDTDNLYDLGSSSFRFDDVYATNGTIQTSDERLKTNIANLDIGLEEIMQLRPVSYDWTSGNNDTRKVGLIAQEVQSLIPELVRVGEDPENLLGIVYADFVPLLIQGIQQQQSQINLIETSSTVSSQSFATSSAQLQTNQTVIASRVTTLEQNVASISGQIASLTTDPLPQVSALADELLDAIDRIDSLETRTLTLEDEVASLSARITDSVLGVNDASTSASLLATNSATLDELIVSGNTTLNDLGVIGTITTGMLTIEGLDSLNEAAINTLAGPLKLQSLALNGVEIMGDKIVIDTNGNITVQGEVTVEKISIDTSDESAASAGKAELPAGDLEIVIDTTAVSEDSLIFVTATSLTNTTLAVTDQTVGESFTVSIPQTQTSDLQFNWWIVGSTGN